MVYSRLVRAQSSATPTLTDVPRIAATLTAQVFLALSRRSGKCSAMKVVEKRMMERDNLEQELLLNQLQKEIQIMRMLDHPNIIQYHNMVETSEKIYCFMELMTGGPFRSIAESSSETALAAP